MRSLPFILFATLAVAGCFSEPPGPRDDRVPRIILGGAHYLWVNDSTIEAEGYFVNPGPDVFDLDHFSATGHLNGKDDGDLTLDETRPNGVGWPVGEVRKWQARFAGAPRIPLYLSVGVYDGEPWYFIGPCMTPDDALGGDCGARNSNPMMDEERERELWPLLQECCNWTPSAFDVYGLDCRLEEASVSCSGNVTNWRDASRNGTGELVLRQVSLATGEPEELARGSFDLGGAYGLHETRPFTASLDLPAGLALSPGHTHQVEAIVTDVAEHAGWANETVLLTFAEVP